MAIEERTILKAQDYASYDSEALLMLLGKQEQVKDRQAWAFADPGFDPAYDTAMMGALDGVKAAGIRVMNRWSKELYQLVCGSGENQARDELMEALNLGETAAIAAVASLLLAIAPAAVAAPLSVLLVKSFVLPAKDELCLVWREQIET